MMEPGRELDAKVAEARIAGDPTRELDDFDGRPRIVVLDANGIRTAIERVPRYSTDIAAAWTLVEALYEAGYNVGVHSLHDWNTRYECTIYFPDVVDSDICTWGADGDTAPHAICLAFLTLPTPTPPPSPLDDDGTH